MNMAESKKPSISFNCSKKSEEKGSKYQIYIGRTGQVSALQMK